MKKFKLRGLIVSQIITIWVIVLSMLITWYSGVDIFSQGEAQAEALCEALTLGHLLGFIVGGALIGIDNDFLF